MQKEALVFFAASLYFLEWKKVMSLSLEVNKSLISKTSESLFNELILRLSNLMISESLNGPWFTKKD